MLTSSSYCYLSIVHPFQNHSGIKGGLPSTKQAKCVPYQQGGVLCSHLDNFCWCKLCSKMENKYLIFHNMDQKKYTYYIHYRDYAQRLCQCCAIAIFINIPPKVHKISAILVVVHTKQFYILLFRCYNLWSCFIQSSPSNFFKLTFLAITICFEKCIFWYTKLCFV